MKYHKQLYKHDPENGIWGDCHRTAIACILDLEILDVPHFYDKGLDSETVTKNEREWLATKGLTSFYVAFECSLEELFTMMKILNPDIYYLLGGKSRTGCNHIVVGYNDKIIHDPSQVDSGIIGPCEDGYYWLTVFTNSFGRRDE